MSKNQPDPDTETAARRLAEALDPSAIDALLADAKAAGTPIDGVDGLLNQMTKAVLERTTAPAPERPAGRSPLAATTTCGRESGNNFPGPLRNKSVRTWLRHTTLTLG